VQTSNKNKETMENRNSTLFDVAIVVLEGYLGYKTIKIGFNFAKNAVEGVKKLVNKNEK
jgi:hypothetical protein